MHFIVGMYWWKNGFNHSAGKRDRDLIMYIYM